MPTLVRIFGPSDCGKTTLIDRLIPRLQAREWRVAVVKHDPHDHWTWDDPNTDTGRHADAGADAVAIVSPSRVGLYQHTPAECDVHELAEAFDPPADVVLLEGFKKHGDLPGLGWTGNAWASTTGAQFPPRDVDGIADWIAGQVRAAAPG